MFRLAGAYVVGAWFLVQSSVTLKMAMDLPGWFDTTMVALTIIGFPIALILGWIFDLTPDGFVRTEAADTNPDYQEKKTRALDLGILVGLVAVAGVMLFGQMRAEPGTRAVRAAKSASVAVLPFASRSAETENTYFADGIHDELLTRLSKIGGIDVISRTSVMGYKDTAKRVPEIAGELGVAAVLEGAVQRSGPRVRITVQLIDGEDDTHLWAEDYDRAMTAENIFDIQAEITEVIATALKTVLTGEERDQLAVNPTESLNAYEPYIQARLFMGKSQHSAPDLTRSIGLFDQAITADPNFGEAYASKAYSALQRYWFHGRKAEDLTLAAAALDRAKLLRPKAPETHMAEAYYAYWANRDYATANTAFDKAIAAAPSHSQAYAGKAFIERRLGNFKAAAAALETVHKLDPLTYYIVPELALTYALIGEFDKANAMMARAKQLDPDAVSGPVFEASILHFQGKPQDAFTVMKDTPGFFISQKMDFAIYSRDANNITQTLENWPLDSRAPDNGPEHYAISRIKGLLAMGKTQEAEQDIAALTARWNTAPRPEIKWLGAAPYSPVDIPGLVGDVPAIDSAVSAFEALPHLDAMAALTAYSKIADAYARAGEPEKAIVYLKKLRDLTGPHIILLLEEEPAMDSLRDHPEYKAMKAAYQP